MLSGQYPNDYTMHDLGTHFPNMTGHPDGRDEYMPVEECGDMLIMGLALVNSLTYESSETAQSPWSALGKSKSWDDLDESASPFSLPATLETGEGIFGLDDQFGGVASQNQAKKWLARSYRLWKQWTGYLVEYSLYPHNQVSFRIPKASSLSSCRNQKLDDRPAATISCYQRFLLTFD